MILIPLGDSIVFAEGSDDVSFDIEVLENNTESVHWKINWDSRSTEDEDFEFKVTQSTGLSLGRVNKSDQVKMDKRTNETLFTAPANQSADSIEIETPITDSSISTGQLAINFNGKQTKQEVTIEKPEPVETPETNENNDNNENVNNNDEGNESEEVSEPEEPQEPEEPVVEENENNGDEEEVTKEEKPEKKEKKKAEDEDEEVPVNTHKKGPLPNITPFAINGLDQGEVGVDKTATPSGNFLEWDVELEVAGKDIKQESYDIVLVFDRSNSMNDGNRETSSKAAAKEFAENLLDGTNSNIKLGVVPFGSDTSGNSNTGRIGLTQNAQAVKNAIDSIIIGPSYSDGGTNISGGLARGKTMVNSGSADHKIIVLFSDGEPTYSLQAADYDKPYSGWSDGSSRYDYILKDFGSRVGNGLGGNTPNYDLGCTGIIFQNCQVKVRDHIIPTISHAHQEIMNAGIGVYSIGFEVGGLQDAQYTLRNSQNLGYYNASTDNISDIFDQISSALKYAANEAYVDDVIGDMFEFVPGSMVTSHGKNANYNYNERKITWDIGNVKEDDGTYTLKYKVRLDCTKNPKLGELYGTNEFATLFYKTANGDSQQKDFPEPKVKADAGQITKIGFRVNAAGDPIDSNGNVVSMEEAEQFYNELHSEGLSPGSYDVPAGTTPNGYELHESFTDPASVDIASTVCVTAPFGYVKTGQFKIEKQDEEDSSITLPGATFKVTGPNGEDLGELTTGPDGTATSPIWPEGTYTLEETSAPDGYEITPGQDLQVTIDGNSEEVATIIITNKLSKGKVKVFKVDEDDQTIPLEGAVFDIQDSDGNSVGTLTTDEDGQAISESLPIGDYTLVEIQAPDNYEFSEGQDLSFTIVKGETTEVTVTNKKQQGKIKLIKTDDTSDENRLEGAKFDVKDEDGTVVDTLVTDENGEATSIDLDVGDYTLEEVEAPYGYELSQGQNFTITVEADSTKTIKITNKQLKGSITILKVDEDGNAITSEDATFIIRDKDGNEVANGTTDADGKIVFDNLPVGEYQIVETKAPEGYSLLRNPIDVEITPDELHITETVVNSEKGWSIPSTGGMGVWYFFGIGLFLMLAASVLFFRQKRKTI